jgi:hypothetical protein
MSFSLTASPSRFVLADDDLGVDARLVDVAKHFDDAAERASRGRRPARNFDDDHVPALRAVALVARNQHVHDEPAIEWDEEPHARFVDVVAADDPRRSAFKDADDASFGAVAAGPLDARDNAIAMHRLVQVCPRDVDIAVHALDRAVRDDESESARMRLDLADDKVHPVGQTEAVAARLNQLSGLDQRLQESCDGGPLFAGDFQALQELTGRCRMVHSVADGREQLFAVQH